MRQFGTILFLLFCFWMFTLPVQAATCRTVDQEIICIEKIKRSAKYPWEYRVNLSINTKKQNLAFYNCREEVIISKNGTKMPFAENNLGQFICQRLGG